jgi:hypothetical protein
MASSLVGLLDNRSRRSSSRLQISSEATSDRGEGWSDEVSSLGVFMSDNPPSEAWAATGAGGFSIGTSLSSSARADCAWGPAECAAKNERHPSVDFIRWAIR